MSVKENGSEHYKTGTVEPIDLYESGGILQDYCISAIIKYAFRNRKALDTPHTNHAKFLSDMGKIKHCADILIERFGVCESRTKCL